MNTKQGREVEFDEMALALGVRQGESVHAETLHHAIRPRNAAITLSPHEHMGGFGVQELEVPEIATRMSAHQHRLEARTMNSLMRTLSLWHLIVRLGLPSMDDIREPYGILNKEDWNIVAHDIPIAFLGIELDGETTDVSDRISAPTTSKHRGEA